MDFGPARNTSRSSSRLCVFVFCLALFAVVVPLRAVLSCRLCLFFSRAQFRAQPAMDTIDTILADPAISAAVARLAHFAGRPEAAEEMETAVAELRQRYWDLSRASITNDAQTTCWCFPAFFFAVVPSPLADRIVAALCAETADTISSTSKAQLGPRFNTATKALGLEGRELVFWVGPAVARSSNQLAALSSLRNSPKFPVFPPMTILAAVHAKMAVRCQEQPRAPLPEVKDVSAAVAGTSYRACLRTSCS